jgi:hypothetical protein
MITKRTEAVGNSNHPVKAFPSSYQSYRRHEIKWSEIPPHIPKVPVLIPGPGAGYPKFFLVTTKQHYTGFGTGLQAGHHHPLPHPYQFSLHLQPYI